MDRNIVTINQPIDPSQMGDDDYHIDTSGIVDASKIVTDVSRDPRGSAHADAEPRSTGPEVVPVTGPLQGVQKPQVRQVKGADGDAELAAFVADLGLDPADMGLVPAAEPGMRPAVTHKAAAAPQEPQQGDALARAEQRALSILKVLPKGCELFVGGETGSEAIELAMGLGFLIGKGLAVYRGDGHYRLKRG